MELMHMRNSNLSIKMFVFIMCFLFCYSFTTFRPTQADPQSSCNPSDSWYEQGFILTMFQPLINQEQKPKCMKCYNTSKFVIPKILICRGPVFFSTYQNKKCIKLNYRSKFVLLVQYQYYGECIYFPVFGVQAAVK